MKHFLLKVDISWKYILEKSPWWGGFYERIIGIIKNCLKKVIWKPCLRYYEVETVLVEIEHTLNSRLLTYMSEENYAESITPHHLLYGRDINRKNSGINYLIELSEASDALKQLSNLQEIVSHIKKDSVMKIFSHYMKDIITIVRVIILIFKTFPLVI